jgi:hypothetical protein
MVLQRLIADHNPTINPPRSITAHHIRVMKVAGVFKGVEQSDWISLPPAGSLGRVKTTVAAQPRACCLMRRESSRHIIFSDDG